MPASTKILTSGLTVRLVVPGSPSLALPAELAYDPDDPYALSVGFGPAGDRRVHWVFSRDLLAAGLAAPAGDGDVRIWPSTRRDDRVLFMAVSAPSGSALFTLPADEVAAFLARTERAVPMGGEHAAGVDRHLQRELDRILGGVDASPAAAAGHPSAYGPGTSAGDLDEAAGEPLGGDMDGAFG